MGFLRTVLISAGYSNSRVMRVASRRTPGNTRTYTEMLQPRPSDSAAFFAMEMANDFDGFEGVFLCSSMMAIARYAPSSLGLCVEV